VDRCGPNGRTRRSAGERKLFFAFLDKAKKRSRSRSDTTWREEVVSLIANYNRRTRCRLLKNEEENPNLDTSL